MQTGRSFLRGITLFVEVIMPKRKNTFGGQNVAACVCSTGTVGFRTVKGGPRLADRQTPITEASTRSDPPPQTHKALSHCSYEPPQSIQTLSSEGSLSRPVSSTCPRCRCGVGWSVMWCLGVTPCSLDAASLTLQRRLSPHRELLDTVLCGSERGS